MSLILPDWGKPRKVMQIDAASRTEFVVKDLGDASNVRIVTLGLSHNSGTPNLEVLVSSNNGASWLSTGEYGRAGTSAGTASFVLDGSVAVTPRLASGRIDFNSFNKARRSMCRINGGDENAMTSGRQAALGYQVNKTPLNAVRVRWSSDTPILTGYFACYAREGFPWPEPFDFREAVSGVATVDFYDLYDYRLLLFEIFGASHGAATPNLEVLISLDDGVTWLSTGEYGRYGTNEGTLSWVLVNDAATSPATHYARLEINNANQLARSLARINGGQSNTAAGLQTAPGIQENEGVITAVRFQWTGGATNFTAGDFFGYGVP